MLVTDTYIAELYKQVELTTEHNHLKHIINQLVKDFNLCGITLTISQSASPTEVIHTLLYAIYDLVQYRFDTFLQLLYRIDVSHHWNDSQTVLTSEEVAQQACEAILKRTIQKIKWRIAFENQNIY